MEVDKLLGIKIINWIDLVPNLMKLALLCKRTKNKKIKIIKIIQKENKYKMLQ